MANIHTLGDTIKKNDQPQRFNQPSNNRQGGSSRNNLAQYLPNAGDAFNQEGFQPLTLQHIKFAQQNKVLFVSGRRIINPKDQYYWDMLKEACCPVCSLLSFTTLILIIDFGMFLASLIIGINTKGDLLQVKIDTLIKLGANYSPGLQNGQVYRVIAPIVLHGNFIHYLGNTVATLIFLSRVEYTYGTIKIAIFYFIAGIGGNIFSALVDPDPVKVGASTSLFGVIGLILGYTIINWIGMEKIGPVMRYQICMQVFIVIIFIFIFTTFSANIDVAGHGGGFLTGLWLSAFHATLRDTWCQRALRIIFALLLIIQFVLCFVLFYVLERGNK